MGCCRSAVAFRGSFYDTLDGTYGTGSNDSDGVSDVAGCAWLGDMSVAELADHRVTGVLEFTLNLDNNLNAVCRNMTVAMVVCKCVCPCYVT